VRDVIGHKGKLIIPCVVLLILVPPILADSQSWEAVLLDSPDDWFYVFPNNMNESGTIIGFWQPADFSETHAIVWKDADSSPQVLAGLEGDTDSWSANVNASGTVCGISGNWPDARAVTWNGKGEVTDRHPEDQAGSDLWSINDKGEGVGSAWEEWPWTWACFWPKNDDAVLMDKGEDYISTWAIAINNNSWVAGIGYDIYEWPYYARAIYWDGDGKVHGIHEAVEYAADMDLLWSMAYQVTDKEEIVGYAGDGYGLIMSFAYTEDGGAILLDQDGEDQGFAWQGSGKYLVGAIGGAPWAPWAWGGATAAVWMRGTEKGETTWTLPAETMLGALCHYIAHAPAKGYQPTNVAFGLLPPLEPPVKNKGARKQAYVDRALRDIDVFAAEIAGGDRDRILA